jgi:hypothetical protein
LGHEHTPGEIAVALDDDRFTLAELQDSPDR